MSAGTGSLSSEQRKQQLARVVQGLLRLGGRVESATDYQVVLAFGGRGMKPWVHGVHAFMTLGTLGIWSGVWAVHWARSRGRRRLLSVDEQGRVSGNVWKPPRDGASPPTIGAVVSREGMVTVQPGESSASIVPDISTNIISRICAWLVTDPGGGAHLSLINNQWKIGVITFSISRKAEQPANIYWFVLN